MIGWFLVLAICFVGAVCVFALCGRRRGRRFVVIPPSQRAKPDPLHRQAIHHFASGVLPPWR